MMYTLSKKLMEVNMLRYRNGKLYAKGYSFEIPEDFYLNTEPGSTDEYMVEFFSLDKSYSICFKLDESCEDIQTELEYGLTEDAGGTALKPIEDVVVNGIRGKELYSTGGRMQEYHLRLSETKTTHFVVYVTTFGSSIIETMNTPQMEKIIQSITFEKM